MQRSEQVRLIKKLHVMSASQQISASSGALEYSLFGRNEPALHHYHQTYRNALGMEPLPLLSEDEAVL